MYEALTSQLGPELFLLREAPLQEIASLAGEPVAQGISLLRQGRLAWQPGFDAALDCCPFWTESKKESRAPRLSRGGRMKFIKSRSQLWPG